MFKWIYRKIYYCTVRRNKMSQYEIMDNELEDINVMKQEEEVKFSHSKY